MYCAIIGDIINSRIYPNRDEIQQNLARLAAEINSKYSQEIQGVFSVTMGDEIQGLLKSPQYALEIIQYIQLNLQPVKLRFGIGVGEVTTVSELSTMSDGPAYYFARDMLSKIKEKEMSHMTEIQDVMYSDGKDCELINAALSLCTLIRTGWTPRQIEVILDKITYQDTQREAALRLKINQTGIHRALRVSGYYSYEHAWRAVSSAIMQRWREYA